MHRVRFNQMRDARPPAQAGGAWLGRRARIICSHNHLVTAAQVCLRRYGPIRKPDQRLTDSRVAQRRQLDEFTVERRLSGRIRLNARPYRYLPYSSRCSKYQANHPGGMVRRVMTTHPTSVNAGSADRDWTVGGAGHAPGLRPRPHSEQRVAKTVDEPAALIAVERHRHEWEKHR